MKMSNTKIRAALLILTFLGTLLGVGNSRTFAGQSCIDIYKPSSTEPDPSSWAFQSFTRDVALVENFFVSQKNLAAPEVIKNAMKSGMRVVFFRLQSAAQVYKAQDLEFFGPLRDEFKKFEDNFGRYDLALSLGERARELGDKDLLARAEAREQKAFGNLKSVLDEAGWLSTPDQAAKTLSKRLYSYEWRSGIEDRRFIQNQLVEYATDLHKDIKDMKFDKKDIEKGLHELRRRLRWILIEANSFNGFIETVPEKLKNKVGEWYEELEASNPKLMDDKYIRFQKPTVKEPLRMPIRQLAIINEVVSQIGALKDKAEAMIEVEKMLDESGVVGERREQLKQKLIAKLGAEDVDHRKASRNFMKVLDNTKLLKNFAKSLEEINQL
jgi:hypothetical protein